MSLRAEPAVAPPARNPVLSIRRSPRTPLVAVIGAFVLAQAGFFAAGVRFDAAPLDGRFVDDLWQLLPLPLLHHHLVQSLWYLHSQPPLFNLGVGLLVKLPHGLQVPAEYLVSESMAFLLVTTSYLLAVELSVPPRVAAVVVIVFVVASPDYVLFQNWLDYAYPTATLLVLSAWSLIRYVRTRRTLHGVLFFSAASALVLLNSTYQWVWLAGVSALVLVLLRRRWRQVLAVASVPLLAVGFWYAKDAAVFGTATTSSWLGMNLAKAVLFTAPPSLLTRLERQGVLTPLASVAPFSPPGLYAPRFAHLPRTGVPALDLQAKNDGVSNFDNLLYVQVSSLYLHDDLQFIRAEPGRYAANVGMAIAVWNTPADQYFPFRGNRLVVSGYTATYDRIALQQPDVDRATGLYPLLEHRAPPLHLLSFGLIAELALALVGVPFLARTRFRHDRAAAASLIFLWFTVAYAFVVTSLLELGENDRFRFELGPLPLIAAVVVVTTVARRFTAGRGAG